MGWLSASYGSSLWFHRLHNIVGASTNDDRIKKNWSFCSLWHLSIYTSAFLILCSTTKAPWPSEEEATVFQEPSDMENLPILRHTVELDEFAIDNDMWWSSCSECSSKTPSCVDYKLERITSKRQLIFGSLCDICHEILSNYVSGQRLKAYFQIIYFHEERLHSFGSSWQKQFWGKKIKKSLNHPDSVHWRISCRRANEFASVRHVGNKMCFIATDSLLVLKCTDSQIQHDGLGYC